MKHLFNLATTILLLILATQLKAQMQNIAAKKFVSSAEHSAKSRLDARIDGKFRKTFPNAVDISWEPSKEGDYSFRFTSNNITELAFFSKRGQLLSTIRYLSNKELPADVFETVKFTYPLYSVVSGEEITSLKNTVYLVTIEYKNAWKKIRVAEGETDVYEEHLKN